ncbi:MAG: DUF934 domain-containing protein [Alphaproteobacteria bacterium]|nr:DUF934 domain-containing protein [Alphaproteobacteria bacterium]
MPLLKDGREVDNVWAHAEDGHELSPGGCITVSLGRFLSEHDVLLARNEAIGVRLAPSDDPGLLKEHLDRLHVIEVMFPKYTDGRGYSIAQLLRRRLGYKGEMRAVGHVLRDQLGYMKRAGFDAMMFDSANAEDIYAEATAELSEVYQATADGRETVFVKRHRGRA